LKGGQRLLGNAIPQLFSLPSPPALHYFAFRVKFAPMPNQRSKNKAHLGGFIEKELNDELIRLAHEEGMGSNKFGFVQKLIREALDRRNRKRKNPPSKAK
jgi:hypothetical protein